MIDVTQGDQYELEIKGTGFVIGDVASIEFTIGPMTKSYPGTVRYDAQADRFYFPLTQQETFRLQGDIPGQARVKFTGGDVIGADMSLINIQRSISKVVL